MSMVRCKECKAEISSKAASCPKCGAPRKKKSSGVGCLVALILSAAVVWIIAESSDLGTSSKPKKTMAVSVSWGNTTLQVKNTGTPDIAGKSVVVYVNGMPPFTYKSVCAGPAVGESVQVPLNSFVKRDGTRFNPYAHAVTEAWIGGSGYDYVQFK